MKRSAFEQLVQEALDHLPPEFRGAIDNVAVVVEDEPSVEILEELGLDPEVDTLFGLYQGTPLPERSWAWGNTTPDRVSIYMQPILESCDTKREIVVAITETVIHEFGHYFGLSEEEIEEIEAKYWRDEDPG